MAANWYRINSNGTLARLKELYRVNSNGTLARLKSLYRLNSNGTLARVFGSDGPTIENTVEISRDRNYHNSTYPVTLTGKKYHFDDADSFSYRFYSSPTGSDPWLPITPVTTTTNPASGSSSTVTYQLVDADFTSNTMYFQFRYTGTDTSVTPNLSTTSASTPISVDYLAIPAPPPGFPNINQSTITVSSTASTGTWTGSPNQYDWRWEYNDGGYKTLTYSQSRSVTSKYLSGFSAALTTSANHGYKANDQITISGMDSLFNGSHTISAKTNSTIYFTLPTPTGWSASAAYSVGSLVSYLGDAYYASIAMPAPTLFSAGSAYSVGDNAWDGFTRYRCIQALSAVSAWSSSANYPTGSVIHYNGTRWQAQQNSGPGYVIPGTSTPVGAQTPSSSNTYYWSEINVRLSNTSYWANAYPYNSSYWTLQSFSNTPASGTIVGSNYYEGTSSSPVSYNIPSFPSTDYKTGTPLLSKLTRMAVTAYNILYNASVNSFARIIYGYPVIFLGTVSKTSTTASITYADVYVDVYDIDVKTQIFISSATVSGSNIVYTTDAAHGLSAGTFVTISGLSPSSFNRSNAEILSTTSNTFTVSNVSASGSSSGTGSISVSGQTYINTISGYPKTNQSSSSPILVTGLVGGKTYTAYITPKNADSPRVSGVQKTTTFTTPIIPINTVLPSITPLNNRDYLPIDTVLTCSTGSWTNVNVNTVYSYDWQYYESATIGWVSLNITTNTYTANFVGDNIRCVVTATNDGQSTSATTISYTTDQAVAVSLVSPTSAIVNTSTNFSFNISHYPTSYIVNWGDGTTDSETIGNNISTVNKTIAHTYTTTGAKTITVTAQPGSKSRDTGISVTVQPPSISNVALSDITQTPSAASGVSVTGSSSNIATISWTNGSPATSINVAYSGAGTNGNYTDNASPFDTSTTVAYTSSATISTTITTYNNNKAARISWNQSNAQSYVIVYSISGLGGVTDYINNSSSSVNYDITIGATSRTVSLATIILYSGPNQTGSSTTYNFSSTVTPTDKFSTGSGSGFVTYTPPVPVNTSLPGLSPTSIAVGTTLTATVGAWSNSPTSYDLRIYRGTQFVSSSETLVASGTSISLNYTITQADYNSGQLYFRAFARASNAGGSSSLVAGQERGPVAPPTTYTVTWNANGGSVFPTSNPGVSGTVITAPTPTRSGYTFLSWRDTPSGDFLYTLNAGGSWTIFSNITFYARWQLAGGTAPATPTGVALSGSGVVSWTASSGATSYEIEFYTAQSSSGLNAAGPYTVTGISASPYQLVSPYASPNNWARVRVLARNSSGASAYSAWVPSATTYT